MEHVLDTCLTHQEVHDAAVLAWYLDTFNSPLLAINIFTTLHRRNNHFKDDDFLSFFLCCCNVFDSKIVVKVFLMQQRLCIPHTFINPELHLNLNDLNEADCKSYFRFSHSEIKRIIVHLQLPEVIIVPTHADRVLIVEAICLLFCPLSYPCHWFDLQNQFGRHINALSQIFYYTMHFAES